MHRSIVALCLLPFFLFPPITGGSEAQREAAKEVISSCWVPAEWVLHRNGLVRVDLVDDIEDMPFRVAGCSVPGEGIKVKAGYDNWRLGARVRWDWGYPSPIFKDVICHEWGHQIYDSLAPEWQEAWNRRVWWQAGSEAWPHPCEGFAENVRLTLYPREMRWRDITVNPIPMMPEGEFKEFLRAAFVGSDPQYFEKERSRWWEAPTGIPWFQLGVD